MGVTAKKNKKRLDELVAINPKSDSELNAFGAWTRTKVETIPLLCTYYADTYRAYYCRLTMLAMQLTRWRR